MVSPELPKTLGRGEVGKCDALCFTVKQGSESVGARATGWFAYPITHKLLKSVSHGFAFGEISVLVVCIVPAPRFILFHEFPPSARLMHYFPYFMAGPGTAGAGSNKRS